MENHLFFRMGEKRSKDNLRQAPKEEFGMKTLLSTTSLVVALGFPDFAQAQATPPPDGPETPGQVDQDPDFLSHPGQPNIFGSELMGHDVYARRPHDSVTDTDNQPYTGPPIDRQSAGALGGDAFSVTLS